MEFQAQSLDLVPTGLSERSCRICDLRVSLLDDGHPPRFRACPLLVDTVELVDQLGKVGVGVDAAAKALPRRRHSHSLSS